MFAVRHGQSELNLLELCNDDPTRRGDLTPLGRQQAFNAAVQLSDCGIERMYCSPLPRTRQTADLIAGRLDVELVVDDRLRDIRTGFDGRPVSEFLAAIAQDPLHAKVAGGESLLQHAARVNGFLDWLSLQPLRRAALVVHEETLRVLRARAEGVGLEQVFSARFDNGAVYAFDL